MNRKIIYSIIIFTFCGMLTGCGHEHTWIDATCTAPKTCSECGETEGEALGHTWVEATCAEPKTCSVCGETEGETLAHTWVEATCAESKHCSVCGETEGEPLEHTLSEANYQQAATCEVCGATVGEPLQAYFEKYGLVCDAELDTTYTFTVPCIGTQNYTIEIKITFSDYEVFESDDNHEAKDGYEWRAVTATIMTDDENARNYNIYVYNSLYDYYDEAFNDTYNAEVFSYNGEDVPISVEFEELQSGWNDDNIFLWESRVYVHIPVGYDGIVSVVRKESDTAEDLRDYADTPEDYICFRLK